MKLPELENATVSAKSLKGIISEIYALRLYSDSSSYDSLKLLWERDLLVTFSSEDWIKIYNGIFPKCSKTYFIPIHLQKKFPNCSSLCYKCKTHKGTSIHVLWSCDRTQTCWLEQRSAPPVPSLGMRVSQISALQKLLISIINRTNSGDSGKSCILSHRHSDSEDNG